jgi:hypothetical protein
MRPGTTVKIVSGALAVAGTATILGLSCAGADDGTEVVHRASSAPDLRLFTTASAPALSASEIAALRRMLPPDVTGDVEDARRAARTGDGATVDVLSAGGQTCVVVRGAGSRTGGCTPDDRVVDAATPPIVVDRVDARRWRVTMLAADAVKHLTVELPDGGSRVVTVGHNVATTVVSGAPARISWDGPGAGTVQHRPG